MFVAYNVGVGAGSLLPISVQSKITCMHTRLTSFVHYFRFGAAILVIGWVLHFFCLYHLVALSFSGKVTKAFPLTPTGYEMAAKRVAWGVFLPPISTTKVKEVIKELYLHWAVGTRVNIKY